MSDQIISEISWYQPLPKIRIVPAEIPSYFSHRKTSKPSHFLTWLIPRLLLSSPTLHSTCRTWALLLQSLCSSVSLLDPMEVTAGGLCPTITFQRQVPPTVWPIIKNELRSDLLGQIFSSSSSNDEKPGLCRPLFWKTSHNGGSFQTGRSPGRRSYPLSGIYYCPSPLAFILHVAHLYWPH